MSNAVRLYGEPGTLYARCGGVFGIASFVDRCMDLWMADKLLNDNKMVARWHASAQRPGFKFLVVQIVCSLTGGPQQYTGRPMDEAHKHLNISEREWDQFMEIFNEVCESFGLPSSDVDDLNALMISMMDECVVFPGERPRRDPGPMRPGGHTLYARVGGVYPISLFIDRLVDALLADERITIPIDGAKRNEASLKYLTTEVMCQMANGPEVVTCAAAEETRLLVPKAAWPIVMLTARLAADHLDDRHRDSLLALLENHKAKFVDPKSKEGPLPRGAAANRAATVKTKEAASWDGGSKVLSRAVINARHAGGGASVAARKRVYGDPRTLYGKGGGVFGLAKVSHELMEAWMADPLLNGNKKVARWHESQQKAGFKFLVTQIMGYMTGGPQKYTGRPMEEAHLHLAIAPAEWQRFMAVADHTFERIQVPMAARRELREILSSFQQQCVLPPGTQAPPHPGAPRPPPSSVGTCFRRLGGVYPIAQFAARLVNTLATTAEGRAIGIAFDALDDPNGRRHAPGLTYLLTELLCSAAGGVEVVTARGFDEAKLGVPSEQWPAFCALAAEAASFFPTMHHRQTVLTIINELRTELCMGGDADDDADTPARRIEAVGFERFDAIAALAAAEGHEEKAIELLLKGWRPEGAAAEAAATAAEAAPKCPFGHANVGAPSAEPAQGTGDDDGFASMAKEAFRSFFSAAPPRKAKAKAGGCPFANGAAMSSASLPPGHPPVPSMAPDAAAPALVAAALPRALADTVRTMAERGGQTAAQIAQMLSLDLQQVEATLHPTEGGMVAPLPPGLAGAALTMVARGVSTDQIATMLQVDQAAVKATIEAEQSSEEMGGAGGGGAGAEGALKTGKRLNDPLQLRLDQILEEESEVCCPVTLVLLVDPVTAKDGFVYERSAAQALCTGAGGRFVSPMTREELPAELTPAVAVRERAFVFRRQRAAEMLAFAEEAAAEQANMGMGVVDRASEYLAALPPEAVAMLAPAAVRACDALLRVARTPEQPNGAWLAAPQQLRRVNALKLQVTAGGGADLRTLTCLVCFDEYPALKGIECAAAAGGGEAGGSADPLPADRHFVCDECLAGHVEAAVAPDSIDLFTRRGGVRCVHPECAAPPFSDGALAKALPERVFATYSAAKERVAEQRINAELEEGFTKRLEIERQRAGGDARRAAIKNHIVERILTLSCPRCSQAFVDFSGCMALTCSRAGCGCGFCALCQADCGNDAHSHVGNGCPLAKLIGVREGEFHLGEAEYTRAAARAREIRLQQYLESLTVEQRVEALEDCAREIADLGIAVPQVGEKRDTAGARRLGRGRRQ